MQRSAAKPERSDFGAKLGFALYYELTGRVVPPEGGVAVWWYSNYDAVTGGIPPELFQILGEDRTLKQSKWSTGDQFNYAPVIPENGNMAAYFSTFRRSFAVLSWISEDVAGFDGIENMQIHRPGSF